MIAESRLVNSLKEREVVNAKGSWMSRLGLRCSHFYYNGAERSACGASKLTERFHFSIRPHCAGCTLALKNEERRANVQG
jgi:hypothetical protein